MRLYRRLRYLLDRNRRDEELAEELAFHREPAEQEQRDVGLAPDKARRAAALRLGNATLARSLPQAPSSELLRQLNQVAASVVEHRRLHRPQVHRRLRKAHACRAQPFVFGLKIVDSERREGTSS